MNIVILTSDVTPYYKVNFIFRQDQKTDLYSLYDDWSMVIGHRSYGEEKRRIPKSGWGMKVLDKLCLDIPRSILHAHSDALSDMVLSNIFERVHQM